MRSFRSLHYVRQLTSDFRMIDGVKLLGWSWPDFKLHSDAAEETLRDLAQQVAHARRTAAQQQGDSHHQSSSSFELHDLQQQQAHYPPQMAQQQQTWYSDPQFQPSHAAKSHPPPTAYAQPYPYPAHPAHTQQQPPPPSHQQRTSTSHSGSISSQHSSQHSQHSQPPPLGLQNHSNSGQYYPPPPDPNGLPTQQLFYEAPRDAQGYEYGWDGSNGDGLG